jgi:hypothetical protein
MWPDLLHTLAGFLCPFRALMQQQQQDQLASAAAAAAAGSSGAGGGGGAAGDGGAGGGGGVRTPKALPGSPHGSLKRCGVAG